MGKKKKQNKHKNNVGQGEIGRETKSPIYSNGFSVA